MSLILVIFIKDEAREEKDEMEKDAKNSKLNSIFSSMLTNTTLKPLPYTS